MKTIDKRILAYILIAVGVFPILVAIFAIMHGTVTIIAVMNFGRLGFSAVYTLIAIGFFVSLLTGFYLLRKKG